MTEPRLPDLPGSDERGDAPEQRATWTELFFDLVVVAGISKLADLLHDGPTWGDLGLYAVLYLAFWIVWSGFMIYGDVRAQDARTWTMLRGMLGLAVLAAAVPEVQGDHAVAFIIVYVVLRAMAAQVWRRGTVVVDWPLAQVGGGTTPWIVSLWVHTDARYWLWALGIAIDLWILFSVSGARVLARSTERLQQAVRRRGAPPEGSEPTIEAARTNPEHVAERLGLYVLIVLGEGVVLGIDAASEVAWDRPVVASALGGFAVLVGLWWLSLTGGFAGVPQLRPGHLPLRRVMLLHALTTGVIAALAAGLGAAVLHAEDHLPPSARWLLCATIAAYAAIAAVSALIADARTAEVTRWALPGLAIPLLLGAFGDHIDVGVLVWALALTVGWTIYCTRPPGTRSAAAQAA
ncbi:low temperature requirement protein A [Conexibacter sp. CPCC 206217]|uniref:low temperature requirement protein A n=1 Tax=Conexibacter sp. CPCC 206217 TaxID=3064574 RepID=UPI0027202916|nr:low temperature requirement protein A [Conexibacter sp. CPCC 206217]MDO8210662.1 low temperature requirement protein A [Conexibacter sp. CPCC 206217]